MTTLERAVRRVQIAVAALIVAANLGWIGVPIFSAALQIRLGWYIFFPVWAVGWVTILAPWACERARRRALDVFFASFAAAYLVATGCIQFCDARAFTSFGFAGVFIEGVLCTWSLAGGFALGVAALMRPRSSVVYRPVAPNDLEGRIACFAPDPAWQACPPVYEHWELDC